MGTKWENGTRSSLCLFFEDRSVDVYVMQVGGQSLEISSLASLTMEQWTIRQSLVICSVAPPKSRNLQIPMLVILVFNTFFLIWVILVS